jgi:hypothetical protein
VTPGTAEGFVCALERASERGINNLGATMFKFELLPRGVADWGWGRGECGRANEESTT